MRAPITFEKKVEEMKPSKSDINWVIMDYLVSEGYPGAAEKFAQETNICQPTDMDRIKERVRIRNALHAGRVEEAINMINEADLQVLDSDPQLHFVLLQLGLIEIIRDVLDKPASQPIVATDFRQALEFATEQLAPRAPTDLRYREMLERTMALMVYPVDKMTPEFKELLDLKLREKVANDVNKAMLRARGERAEAKIRQLVEARAWAEAQARDARVDLPNYIPIGLEAADSSNGSEVVADADAMMT